MHKEIERKILLNPGPATTTDTVKMAQVVPDICPREEEFSELMAGIRNDLLKIVKTDNEKYKAVLFGGSGTVAMESVISSVISKEGTLLILINGAYGDRIRKIAETYSIKHISLEYEWGRSINFRKVDSFLKSNLDIGYIAMVHHETTTGILNSIESFSELSEKYGQTLILDAISSYAGIPIDMNTTPIDYLISTSNKCIQGMPGLAYSICKKSGIKHIKGIPKRSFYLSLYDQYDYMEKTGQMRFTPPVQVIYALRQAIDEYFEEGDIKRYERYTSCWSLLRKGLMDLGFEMFLKPEDESHILTTIIEPDHPNYDYNKMHDLLYEKGFTIYPGKIGSQRTFRLANMGAINTDDIQIFLIELSNLMKKMDILV
jgi:2-aminoethylphosphonate-pyruvate transaminase